MRIVVLVVLVLAHGIDGRWSVGVVVPAHNEVHTWIGGGYGLRIVCMYVCVCVGNGGERGRGRNSGGGVLLLLLLWRLTERCMCIPYTLYTLTCTCIQTLATC